MEEARETGDAVACTRRELLRPSERLGAQRGPMHSLWPDTSVLAGVLEGKGRFASMRGVLGEFGDAVTGRARAGAGAKAGAGACKGAGEGAGVQPEPDAVVARFGRALEGLRAHGVVGAAGKGGRARRVLAKGLGGLSVGAESWQQRGNGRGGGR